MENFTKNHIELSRICVFDVVFIRNWQEYIVFCALSFFQYLLHWLLWFHEIRPSVSAKIEPKSILASFTHWVLQIRTVKTGLNSIHKLYTIKIILFSRIYLGNPGASEQCPADTICFHYQQFVEKLLKAFLTRHSIEEPKIHDLRRLIQLAEPLVPDLSPLSDESDKLIVNGLETRYPGEWYPVSSAEMNEVVEISKKFGDILLLKLE
jgi:HEPN domain-containing protein